MKKNGFTLIEVIVAMAILAIASIPVFGSMYTALNTDSNSQIFTEENEIVQIIAEGIKSKEIEVDEDFKGFYDDYIHGKFTRDYLIEINETPILDSNNNERYASKYDISAYLPENPKLRTDLSLVYGSSDTSEITPPDEDDDNNNHNHDLDDLIELVFEVKGQELSDSLEEDLDNVDSFWDFLFEFPKISWDIFKVTLETVAVLTLIFYILFWPFVSFKENNRSLSYSQSINVLYDTIKRIHESGKNVTIGSISEELRNGGYNVESFLSRVISFIDDKFR